MGNKKAELKNDVLTTIIAVVGLVIVFFAAWQLWSAYTNQEERNAQTIINNLEGKINALEEGQFGKVVVRILPGWVIAGWSKNEDGRPDNCYFKSCICICKFEKVLPGLYPEKSYYADACKTKGFCRLFDEEKVAVFDIYNFEDTKPKQYMGSNEDALLFIKNPDGYNTLFRSLLINEVFYNLFSWQGIWFKDDEKTNLVEISTYNDKTNLGVLRIRNYPGTGNSQQKVDIVGRAGG